MDKNKSAFKLKGLPPIYCINLDDKPERWDYMENQFKYWEIENYERISAHDGREDDLSDIIKGKYPDNMNSGEVGCVTSHLKAIKHWMETSDAPCALIMEDDCDLSPIKHWPFAWKDFYAQVPFDYDIIQLGVINPAQLFLKMHKRFANDFSTACYMITRHHASKIIKFHCRDGKYKLDYKQKPRCCSEHLIYESGNSFAMPLLLFSPKELESMIHSKDHIDAFHVPSRDALRNFWENESNKIANWDELFDYDPFVGRLPPMDKPEEK